MTVVQNLKRAEVFLGLDDIALGKIAALPSCREELYSAGQVIFSAGDEARFLYVLSEGQVKLVASGSLEFGQATKPTVDRITTGGLLGWSAVVEPHFYTMSAVCTEPSRIVAISGAELLVLFERNPHLGYQVLQSLSRIIGTRLRDVEQFLVKGKRWPFLGEVKSQ